MTLMGANVAVRAVVVEQGSRHKKDLSLPFPSLQRLSHSVREEFRFQLAGILPGALDCHGLVRYAEAEHCSWIVEDGKVPAQSRSVAL